MASKLMAGISRKKGSNSERNDRDLSAFIYFFALCGHSAFIVVFYLMGNAAVMANNLLCISVGAACLYLNGKGRTGFSQILFILAVFYHSTFCTLVYGWEPGFFLYPFALAAFLFLSRNRLPVKIGLSSLLFFSVIFLYFRIPDMGSLKIHLGGAALAFMFVSNTASVFLSLCYLANFHTVFVSQTEQELIHIAMHDRLSGLLNHHAVIDRLKAEMRRSARSSGSISILMLDIDHFKHVNDTYGHPFGDRVIAAVAQECTSLLRDYDSVGRYGGEEFLAILPDCDQQNAAVIAERLRSGIERRTVRHNGEDIFVTVSIGTASVPHGGDVSAEEIISRADEALYKAKRGGRNRVVQHSFDHS